MSFSQKVCLYDNFHKCNLIKRPVPALTVCQYIYKSAFIFWKHDLSSTPTFFITVKTNFSIEEYSFGQTTLEQVFIKFAKDQEIEEDHEESETL